MSKKQDKELDKILSSMAFRCAGGITDDGCKQYTPTKEQILTHYTSNEDVEKIIGENKSIIDTVSPSHAQQVNIENQLKDKQRQRLKTLKEIKL